MAFATSLASSVIPSSSKSLNWVSIPISDKKIDHTQLSFDRRSSALSSPYSSTYYINPLHRNGRSLKPLFARAPEHKFPDPIPEFAEAETEKFKSHLIKKLTQKETFEGHVDEIVGICTEILTKFLHTEYGGPGTLLVLPFIDMADTINEQGLPGGPLAARFAVKWAQNHVDKDWKEWTGT